MRSPKAVGKVDCGFRSTIHSDNDVNSAKCHEKYKICKFYRVRLLFEKLF